MGENSLSPNPNWIRETLFEMQPYWLSLASAFVVKTRMFEVHSARIIPSTCPLPELDQVADVEWLGRVGELITETVARDVATDVVALKTQDQRWRGGSEGMTSLLSFASYVTEEDSSTLHYKVRKKHRCFTVASALCTLASV